MECEYCKKSYKTTSSLNLHKRTNKSCLLVQEKNGIHNQPLFTCSYCKKDSSSKVRLQEHMTKCKIKIKEELSKDIKIKELQEQMLLKDEKLKKLEEQVRERPQKISNNIQNIDTQINNITIYQVMTPEHVLDVFKKHYSLDTLLGGQKALARFVNEEFLKEQATPIYVCGDRARQKFYMMKDGKKEEDPDCENIIGLSTPGFPHVREVYEDALFTNHEDITEEQIQDNYRSIANIDKERSVFKSELSKIASNSDTKPTPWQNAVAQLQLMRDKLLPYETNE